MLVGIDPMMLNILQYGFVAMCIAFLGVVCGWIIHWFVLTPKDARELKKAKSKHWPLIIEFFDEGFARLVACKKYTEEIVEDPKSGSLGILPSRPKLIVDEEAAKKNMPDGGSPIPVAEQLSTQKSMSEMGTARFFLQSVGTPLLIKYAPKGIVMNAKTLALIQEGGKESKIKDFQLNPFLIKEYFGRMWLSNRIKAIKNRAYEIGFRDARALVGKWEKWMPVFIILSLSVLILVLGIVVAKLI